MKIERTTNLHKLYREVFYGRFDNRISSLNHLSLGLKFRLISKHTELRKCPNCGGLSVTFKRYGIGSERCRDSNCNGTPKVILLKE